MSIQEIQTELIYFLFVAVLFLLMIFVIFKIFCKKIQFKQNNIKLYGLLMNMNNTSLISISTITIQYLFVVFCTISFHGMNLIYLSVICILVLISEAVIDNFKGLPLSILIALINCGAIHVVYLLYDYITYEEFSYSLLIILFLVVMFVFLFDTYNLVRGINNVVVKNKYLKNKKYTL